MQTLAGPRSSREPVASLNRRAPRAQPMLRFVTPARACRRALASTYDTDVAHPRLRPGSEQACARARGRSPWGHGGDLSLDAAVRIGARDRKGLERLLRYCARPIFASESQGQGVALPGVPRMQRLAWASEWVVYALPNPGPLGQTALYLAPLEFLDWLAAVVPPPRRHRHRYHGVLAPHAPSVPQ